MHTRLVLRHVQNAFLNWLPMVLWVALIYWLSDQSELPQPGRRFGLSDDLVNYSAHMCMFGVLTLLVWRVLASTRAQLPRSTLFWSPVGAGWLSAVYAVTDELHQLLVPGRCARASDLAVDFVGILIAVALLIRQQRRRSHHGGQEDELGSG